MGSFQETRIFQSVSSSSSTTSLNGANGLHGNLQSRHAVSKGGDDRRCVLSICSTRSPIFFFARETSKNAQ